MQITQNIIRALNSSSFIVISANTREQVEKEKGSLEKYTFFRKPLKDDFFEYLDKLIKQIKECPVVPNIKTRQTDNNATEIAIDQLNRLGAVYKKYHDMMWEKASKQLGIYSDRKYGDDEWEKLEKKIEASLEILCGEDSAKKNMILTGLDKEYKSWKTRVVENIDSFVKEQEVTVIEPFRLSSDFRKYQYTIEDEIVENYSLSLNEDKKPIVKINGKIIKTESDSGYYSGRAGGILRAANLMKALNGLNEDSKTRHIRAYWYDYNYESKHSIDGFEIHYKNETLTSIKIGEEGGWYNNDKRVFPLSYENLPDIPPKAIFHGKIDLEVRFDGEKFSVFHNKKGLNIPIDDSIFELRSRGFEPEVGKTGRAKIAMQCIYDHLLGRKTFEQLTEETEKIKKWKELKKLKEEGKNEQAEKLEEKLDPNGVIATLRKKFGI